MSLAAARGHPVLKAWVAGSARRSSTMVAATGDIYYGRWYPIVVAGLLFLPETFRRRLTG